MILIGASDPTKNSQGSNSGISASDVNNAATTISASIKQSVVTPDKDIGCQHGPERRDSDLCAQWKAADAAHDAAKYALWSIGIGIVGTGFLYVTFRETRRVSRAQLRAYVSITPGGLKIVRSKQGRVVTASLKVKNSGQTPAYAVVWSGNIIPLSADQTSGFFSASNDSPEPIRDQRPTVLHNSDNIDGDIQCVDPISDDDWDAILNRNKSLFLYGVGEYKDVFSKKRVTQFCFLAEHESILAGHLSVMTGGTNQIPLVWQQASLFNHAT